MLPPLSYGGAGRQLFHRAPGLESRAKDRAVPEAGHQKACELRYNALIGKQTPQSLKDAVVGETKAADLGGDVMDIDHDSFAF